MGGAVRRSPLARRGQGGAVISTLAYLAEARRRGARGTFAVKPVDCKCEICEQRIQRCTIRLNDSEMLEVSE